MLIALDYYPVAIKILEEILESSLIGVYTDKSLFLLGKVYQFGIMDIQKARELYSWLLESFPNSLHFDDAREILNDIQNKIGESI